MNAAGEAVTRHGVQDVVLPSLDAHTREMEGKAIERMHELQLSSSQHAQQPVTLDRNPHAFVQRMLESAHSGDWAAFRHDTQTLAAMQPGRDMHAQAVASVDLQQHVAQQQAIQQATDQQQAMGQTATQGMGR